MNAAAAAADDDDDDDEDVNNDRGPQRYTKWSQCSKTKLKESLARGLGICLDNVPDTYISAQCGNGIVDDGEQCDCGLAPNAEVTMIHTLLRYKSIT